jgi:cell division protein FtsN
LEKYQKALDVYKHFLLRYAGSKYAPQAYVKAYYAAKKVGAWDDARSFADTLRQKYPRAIEISLVSSADQAKTMYDFKAQVGVFANRKNADILARKLERSGFSPSVTEDGSGNERVFRVVCGAYADPDLADRLVRELKSKGYPAKRIP